MPNANALLTTFMQQAPSRLTTNATTHTQEGRQQQPRLRKHRFDEDCYKRTNTGVRIDPNPPVQRCVVCAHDAPSRA